jgi:hypothetical protein
MANDPTKPEPGDFHIDASLIAAFAAYLKEGELQGKRREQRGLDDVIREILSNHAIHGARAGVTDEDIRSLQASNERIEMVRAYLGPVRRLVEILEGTEGEEDDKRHRVINAIATAVDRRAVVRGNEDLVSRYSKTREYRSAIAVKAVRTRLRNQEDTGAGDPPSGSKAPSRRRRKAKGQLVASAKPTAEAALAVPAPGSSIEQA